MQVVTIRMPKELHNILKNMAKEKGLTLNGLIVSIFWQHLRK